MPRCDILAARFRYDLRAHARRPTRLHQCIAVVVVSVLVRSVRIRQGGGGRQFFLRAGTRRRRYLCDGAATRGTRHMSELRQLLRAHWPSLVATAAVALYLFPLYWMLVSGFKTPAEIVAN